MDFRISLLLRACPETRWEAFWKAVFADTIDDYENKTENRRTDASRTETYQKYSAGEDGCKLNPNFSLELNGIVYAHVSTRKGTMPSLTCPGI